jgi:hypothetical protein
MQVNLEFYESLTSDSFDALIARLREAEGDEPGSNVTS